jgi:hypothetical protein
MENGVLDPHPQLIESNIDVYVCIPYHSLPRSNPDHRQAGAIGGESNLNIVILPEVKRRCQGYIYVDDLVDHLDHRAAP